MRDFFDQYFGLIFYLVFFIAASLKRLRIMNQYQFIEEDLVCNIEKANLTVFTDFGAYFFTILVFMVGRFPLFSLPFWLLIGIGLLYALILYRMETYGGHFYTNGVITDRRYYDYSSIKEIIYYDRPGKEDIKIALELSHKNFWSNSYKYKVTMEAKDWQLLEPLLKDYGPLVHSSTSKDLFLETLKIKGPEKKAKLEE